MLPSGALKVSSIYKWFQDDFGGNEAGVLAHFKRYAGQALAARLSSATKIESDDYNWSLDGVAAASK